MKAIEGQALLERAQLLEARAQALGNDLDARATGEGPGVASSTRGAFGDLMRTSLDQVNDTMRTAQAHTEAFLRADPDANLVETMVAVNKAQVSFRTIVEVRNQLVQAYKDIANMPI